VTLIDDEGRLFGRVNIIDAFVVLVVIAVVFAGLLFVLVPDSSPSSSATRYATIDLGTQPDYVATLITEGDSIQEDNGETITITDVYATASGSDRRVRVRARITAPVDSGTITYDGTPLRVGRNIRLQTDEYTTQGTVTSVANTTPDLSVTSTDVLLRTTLSPETASDIESGQTFRVDGRPVATIRSVNAYPSGDGNVLAILGITYQTYISSDKPYFGDTVVRDGATLPFEADGRSFQGEVIRRGVLSPPGEETTRTVSLKMERVDPDLASGIRTGLTEGVRGETIAQLVRVEVEPATVVLTSQDGDVYRRQHPVQKDITMTAELKVRETDTGVRFKGAPIQQGGTVVLDFGVVSIEATVLRI